MSATDTHNFALARLELKVLGVISWHPSPAALMAVGGDLFIITWPTSVAAAPSERIVNSITTRAPVHATVATRR